MNSIILLIIIIPIVEIYLFIKVGSQIGAFNTISLIIITYFLAVFPLPIPALISFIFIAYLCIFIYSIAQCIYGVEPEIPLISKSVRMQI